MRGEGQKAWIVQRLAVLPAQHHHLLIVVQTGRGHASQVGESADVFAHRRLEVHAFHPAQIGSPREAQDVAEQVHAPPAFLREVQIVDAVIGLGLGRWTGLEAYHRSLGRPRPQGTHSAPDLLVAAAKALGTQLLPAASRRELRMTLQQLAQRRFIGVDGALTRRRRLQFTRHVSLSTLLAHRRQHPSHRAPRHAQLAGNMPLRLTLLPTLHDVMA